MQNDHIDYRRKWQSQSPRRGGGLEAEKTGPRGPRRAHVARSEAKPPRKASPAKTAPKSRKKPEATRADSKTAKILGLLKRQGGATAKDLQKATGWQPHSVRGFLSGIISKKMGLDGHIDQSRGRGALLLDQNLILATVVYIPPPNTFPAALLVLEDA